MKLHHTQNQKANHITAYDEGYLEINGIAHTGNLIVTATHIVSWPVSSFHALEEKDFASLLAFDPAVVLLGTGTNLRFPHPSLTQCLTQRQIGVDAMDTGAACRTFNVLVAEDRQVVMGIIHH